MGTYKLCPGCSQPFIQAVKHVGLQDETIYVHEMVAAGSLGVRASGCIFTKGTKLLSLVDEKDILKPSNLSKGTTADLLETLTRGSDAPHQQTV